VVAACDRLALDAVARVKGLRSDQRAWTPEEDATLARMTADGATKTEIGRVLDRSPEAVANRRWKTGVRSPLTGKPKGYSVQTLRPVMEYTPPPSEDNVGLRYAAAVLAPESTRDETDEEFLERVMRTADRSVAKAKEQKHATLKIASDKPVALMCEGDLHIATKGTDLRWIKQRAEFVANTPGMFGIGLGDMIQNDHVHRDRDVHDIADQLRLLDLLIQWHKGKFLGGVTGNHDDWTRTTAGFNHIKALADRHKFHQADDELIWRVQIHKPEDVDHITAEWTIATRHQVQNHSSLNPLHACWRWLERNVGNWERVPDVLVLAHNHAATVGVNNYMGKDVWGVRMGSPQVGSGYARQKGFIEQRQTAPVIVMPPHQVGRIVCFSDAEDAVQHMRGWRDVAA